MTGVMRTVAAHIHVLAYKNRNSQQKSLGVSKNGRNPNFYIYPKE